MRMQFTASIATHGDQCGATVADMVIPQPDEYCVDGCGSGAYEINDRLAGFKTPLQIVCRFR